jgi:hypothetical protein
MVNKRVELRPPRLALRNVGLPKRGNHGGDGRCAGEPCCDRTPLLRAPLLPDPGTEQEDQSQSADNADDD